MNDAIYKFKRYEDSSLSYTGINRHEGEKVGLFNTALDYDEMFVEQQASTEAPPTDESDVPEQPYEFLAADDEGEEKEEKPERPPGVSLLSGDVLPQEGTARHGRDAARDGARPDPHDGRPEEEGRLPARPVRRGDAGLREGVQLLQGRLLRRRHVRRPQRAHAQDRQAAPGIAQVIKALAVPRRVELLLLG